ncbi:MAG TPA: ComF family protein [Fimbriimonadaceae bacterium]|nr:ComF family protein [Fimbriimonadaceae bacterium]
MSLLSGLFDLAFPSRCGICGLLGDLPLCQICRASFKIADEEIVPPEWRGALDGVSRAYQYEGRAEQAVRRLKYSRATTLAGPMSLVLLEQAQRVGLAEPSVVIPVPIHWTRRYYRGFNQAELLAEALPTFDSKRVRRIRATRPQVGLTLAERRRNLIGAFQCSGDLSGQTVVLVDDVITTGHTVEECAKVIKASGAERVYALAFCGG